VRVLAVELSAAARAVAARNLAALGLAERVTVLDGDLFDPLARWAGAVDLIVANPPTSRPARCRAARRGPRWEPRGRSTAARDGMAGSRRIIAGARAWRRRLPNDLQTARATAECVNAHARRYGVLQFAYGGGQVLKRHAAVAITHNLLRWIAITT